MLRRLSPIEGAQPIQIMCVHGRRALLLVAASTAASSVAMQQCTAAQLHSCTALAHIYIFTLQPYAPPPTQPLPDGLAVIPMWSALTQGVLRSIQTPTTAA
eukprot:COSAG06_NODE_5245_length_3613_cov_1.155663_4_plen_101_part_00